MTEQTFKCATCEDGEYFPHYGLAPHKHDMSVTGSIIGSTVLDAKSEWPSNFHPDAEDDSAGVWACPDCDGYGQNAREPSETDSVPAQDAKEVK